jgi:putative MATE family efflux protein
MMLGIAQGFTQGFCIRMSQKFGARDEEGLKQTLGTSILLTDIVAIIGTLIAQLGLPTFLKWMQAPDYLTPSATLYSRIIIGGFAAVCFFSLCSSTLRAVGDSKTPLIAMVIAATTNIALDIVAVFILKWGIAGAAIATVFSQLLSGLLCAIKILKTPELQFEKRHLTLDLSMAKDLMGIGIPAAAKNIIIAVGGMIVQTVVNSFDSMSFIAGFTATNKLYGLLEIAALSYGYAVTTYVGQNYGAGHLLRIRSGVRAANTLALLSSVVIGVIMIVFGRPISMLFISREDAQLALEAGEAAYRYLCLMSVSLPVLYVLYVYMSALQGMGNTVAPMWSAAFELLIRLAVAFTVAQLGIRSGIFWAEVGAWYGGAVTQALGYFLQIRKLKKQNLTPLA